VHYFIGLAAYLTTITIICILSRPFTMRSQLACERSNGDYAMPTQLPPVQWLLAWLRHTLATLWRQLWHSALMWFTNKPTTPFKPWLHPVSKRAASRSSAHWRSKPDWVREAILKLAL
jgi:hypothetical protein